MGLLVPVLHMDQLKPKRGQGLRGMAAWAPFRVCHKSDREGGKDRARQGRFFPKVLSTHDEESECRLEGKAFVSGGA